jgi:ferredoxin
MKSHRLVLDPIACDGHGLCHEMFPEGIDLDDWNYPIITRAPLGKRELRHARRAAAACPCLALRIVVDEA